MLTGRSCGSTGAISRPASRMRPSSGVSKPASMRSSVVLPQPLGPNSAKNSPAGCRARAGLRAETAGRTSTPPRSGATACHPPPRRVPPTRRYRPADFRRLLVHVIYRPHRARTLAADRHPLNRPVTWQPQYCGCRAPPARLAQPLRAKDNNMNRDRSTCRDHRLGSRRRALPRRRRLHAVGLARRRGTPSTRRSRRIRVLHWRISARARLHQLNMEGGKARAMAAQARELAAAASQREKSHVEIMAAVIESKPKIAVTGAEAHLEDIRATRRCCRSCSARSASTHSRAVPTTMPPSSRSASAMRGTMARTGGSSVTSAGRIPRR